MRALVLGTLLLVTNCTVSPADWVGGACDATHPCPEGGACVAGVCEEDRPGGGTSACVTWQQRANGFSGTEVSPTADLSIDATQGNRLSVGIVSGNDGSDIASGRISAELLPTSLEGELSGTLTIPADARPSGALPFVRVRGTRGTVVELFADNNGSIGAFTTAGVLQSAAVDQPRSSAKLETGREHVFRVLWRTGAFRRIYVDGALLLDATLEPFTGTGATPTSFELGILGAESGQDPVSLSFADWQLCDDADGSP